MSIRKIYTIPSESDKELLVKSDEYFCYKCNTLQKIFVGPSPLQPCKKCGHWIFYTF